MERSGTLNPGKAEASPLGFGPSAPSKSPLPPPPPPVEVLFSDEESVGAKSNVEPIVIDDGLSLLKGRVSTFDVFGMTNSDLVPGKYEGGLKLWEGSLDLVKRLRSDVQKGELVLKGKRVLEVPRLIPEVKLRQTNLLGMPWRRKIDVKKCLDGMQYTLLGCGHGLPGIFTGLEGASVVHFQDFNAEVLRSLTMPNVKVNLKLDLYQGQSLLANKSSTIISPDVRFFAGDWNEVHQLLPNGSNGNHQNASLEGTPHDGYDVILMAETVYAPSSLHGLYSLIKRCLHRSSGLIYMAGKKYYFGVGGGTRQFINLVEEDGVMKAYLLAEVADGSSNVREVWKLMFK